MAKKKRNKGNGIKSKTRDIFAKVSRRTTEESVPKDFLSYVADEVGKHRQELSSEELPADTGEALKFLYDRYVEVQVEHKASLNFLALSMRSVNNMQTDLDAMKGNIETLLAENERLSASVKKMNELAGSSLEILLKAQAVSDLENEAEAN